MRWSILGLGILVLCRCATQHVTKEYAPFFRVDAVGQFTAAQVYEKFDLQSRPNLSLWESKRLLELYEHEIRTLKKTSPQMAALSAQVELLAPKVEPLAQQVERAKKTSEKTDGVKADAPAVFSDESFKKDYTQAYRAWNRDENALALEKALELSKDPRFAALKNKERFKVWNLQFRIALDLQNLNAAFEAYQRMQDLENCGTETAEAGFLLALTYLGSGEGARAKTLFENQCDPDESASNQVRRSYWLARLQEGVGKSANEAYHQIIDAGVPGYYDFLAHARLAEPMSYTSLRGHSYRTETLSMPAAVSDLLQQAEKCLDVHLRSDATVFLQSAAVRLKKAPRKESIPSLLYTAYLFQAAGQQLEAFKLYSVASELAQAYPHSTIFDFLTEMFPAPHAEFVSAVAKEWKVDADFLYAIMRQESAFNPGAVSSASARGLMQLMPFLGSQISRLWRYDAYYTNRSLFFAKENLAFAAYHLQQVQAILPHPALIAAAYNAGTKRVAQWWKRAPGLPLDIFIELIPVVETRNYVKLVLRNFLFYKLIRSGGALHPSTVPFRLPEPIALTAER